MTMFKGGYYFNDSIHTV